MSRKVIILGGGVAGMSAAHELVERGFQVTVYEKKSIAGGKARSVLVPNSGKNGNKDLPGEHGFRFFPSFYHHVTDTMKRIPYRNNKQGVFDNLTNTTQIGITQFGKHEVLMLAQFPRSFEEMKILLTAAIDLEKYVGLTKDDIEFFAAKLWRYLTTCQDRRMDDLEKIGWWEYSDASNRSEAYQKFLAQGLTRSLVAANAHVANAKVEGDVGIQLILGLAEPGVNADRVLNGPTNEVWIDPWLKYLESKGVEYCMDTRVYSIECDGNVITGVTLQRNDGTTFQEIADYYVLAVPVEQARQLLKNEKQKNILKADSTLKGVIELGKHVAWMNGLQFYFTKDVPMVHGHMIHIDTPWALTTISQAQFWTDYPWAQVGDGTVKGILSVDISEWGSEWHGHVVGKGILYDKVARDCSRQEIIEEVWAQLQKSVNVDGKKTLEGYESVFIDPDIQDKDVDRNLPTLYDNAEPLYIDMVDSWHLRPDAYTRIPNFFLAADYVRTNTQLATMEGANEAARRAVNSIISASGANVPLCKIWPIFSIWRWYDQRRYDRGEPWKSEFPWFIEVAGHLLVTAYQFWHNATGRKRK
jgi:15-cis-phytoene desaturase